jgi:hypothetical protein
MVDSGAGRGLPGDPGARVHRRIHAPVVAASRGWPAKLEGLPKTAPDFWTLIKSGGGNIEVNSSASRSTFTIIGFRGFSARVVHDADRLVDLQIE